MWFWRKLPMAAKIAIVPTLSTNALAAILSVLTIYSVCKKGYAVKGRKYGYPMPCYFGMLGQYVISKHACVAIFFLTL